MAPSFGPNDPITASEISRVFRSLWQLRPWSRLGLAISGGVDSMALAYLWSRYRLDNASVGSHYVRGFVIDHGLRRESFEEAQLVASRLEPLLGRPGQIITLNWDRFGGPPVAGMETAARRLRFQALAEAAHQNGINCLMMGHHVDDVVETTINRISNGGKGSGLFAFKTFANLPECHGMFGVHQSGEFRRLQFHDRIKHYVGGTERGGIQIAHPFLQFPKSRLIATCEVAGIRWVEDHTNKNVQLTPRNTIRALLKHECLPMALRKPSIEGLLSNIQEQSTRIDDIKAKIHEATFIKSLDLRSGVIDFYLPTTIMIKGLIAENSNRNLVLQALACQLRDLAASVSADSNMKLIATLDMATIFLEELETGVEGNASLVLSTGKVDVKRLQILNQDGDQRIGIRMFRRAYYSPHHDRSDVPRDIVLQPQRNKDLGLEEIATANDFHLWDGRFWICAQNFSPLPLRIVVLDESRMTRFVETRHGANWQHYVKVLKEAAPGISRWTIPAIVCDFDPPEESKIPPMNMRWKRLLHLEPRTETRMSYEIYKHSRELPGAYQVPGEKSSREWLPSLPGKLSTVPMHLVDSSSEANLSRRPISEQRLWGLPIVPKGEPNPAKYPAHTGSFVVAIPTMGFFLNSYWSHHLRYDIRYKEIPLTDMQYVSRYRLEKPAMINGIDPEASVPHVVGEQIETENLMEGIASTSHVNPV